MAIGDTFPISTIVASFDLINIKPKAYSITHFCLSLWTRKKPLKSQLQRFDFYLLPTTTEYRMHPDQWPAPGTLTFPGMCLKSH